MGVVVVTADRERQAVVVVEVVAGVPLQTLQGQVEVVVAPGVRS